MGYCLKNKITKTTPNLKPQTRKTKQNLYHLSGFSLGKLQRLHFFFPTFSDWRKWTFKSLRIWWIEDYFYLSCRKFYATSLFKTFFVGLFSNLDNFWHSETDMWPFQAGTIRTSVLCTRKSRCHSLCSTTHTCPKGMRLNRSHIQTSGASSHGQWSIALGMLDHSPGENKWCFAKRYLLLQITNGLWIACRKKGRRVKNSKSKKCTWEIRDVTRV